MFKKLIKKFVPNLFINKINSYLKRNIRIVGSYSRWDEALKESGSYSNHKIFLKTKKSFLKISKTNELYERDTVIFYDKQINKPMISLLEKLRLKNKTNLLKVLDYGGSIGSTYFQNRKILLNNNNFQWDIIEQKKIVNFANKSIKLKNLRFFKSLDSYLNKNFPDIILFSSVLHYLESPYDLIKKLIRKKIKYFLILKTPFYKNKTEIKIQLNPKNIYEVNYPIRIFNNKLFLSYFKNSKYKVEKLNWDNQVIDDIHFESYFFKKNNAK